MYSTIAHASRLAGRQLRLRRFSAHRRKISLCSAFRTRVVGGFRHIELVKPALRVVQGRKNGVLTVDFGNSFLDFLVVRGVLKWWSQLVPKAYILLPRIHSINQ